MDKLESRKQLGAVFQRQREKLNMTAEHVAISAGITANTYGRIEQGKFAWDIDLHSAICKTLKLSPCQEINQ